MSWKRIFFDRPLALLDQFTECVNEDRLGRLSYNTWRNIKSLFLKADVDNCQVGFEFDEDGRILMGLSKRDVGNYDPNIVDGINTDDGSFGEFITSFLDGMDLPWRESKPMFIPYEYCGWNTLENLGEPGVIAEIAPKHYVVNYEGKIITEDNNIERESNNMKFNFDFGSCENDNVKVSPYGIAVLNAAGTWVSYDAKSGNIIDVDIFNFNGGKYLFKMPVALKDVKPGDTVIHNRVPVFVVAVEGADITVVDPRAGDKKTILPVTNMFGFNFIIKIVSLLEGALGTPTNDNPFGNMLPFFLMSNSDNKGGKNDIDPLMMAMLLNGNLAAGGFQNPLMLALMCGDQTNMRDVLPLMMLTGQANTPVTPAAK